MRYVTDLFIGVGAIFTTAVVVMGSLIGFGSIQDFIYLHFGLNGYFVVIFIGPALFVLGVLLKAVRNVLPN